MAQSPTPSPTSIAQAQALGKLMAGRDPRLTPILDSAHQYLSYVQFMVAHRHRLQQASIFQEWEEKIQQLVDQEVKHRGMSLDNPRHWELVENSLSVPLHCAFWFGWETVYNLKDKFENAVAAWHAAHPIQPRRQVAPPTPQVNDRPATPLNVEWDAKPGQDVPQSPAIVRNAERVPH